MTDLPTTLRVERRDATVVLTLARPAKRNALDDATVAGIAQFFDRLDADVRAVVLDADGDHFCAGLDLTEMGSLDTISGVMHSRSWHRVFERVQNSPVPVISVLRGAVIGGGLELAAATHLRVADETAFFALPEGQRGLFLGGGGSVRLPRLIGVSRVMDMMLTGRRYDANAAAAIGLVQYCVAAGTARTTALELAARVAQNAPQTNFAVLQALPAIAATGPAEGLLFESLMAAIAQGTDDAKGRMSEFLAGRAPKVTDR